jgi:hypothetical protein
MVLSDIGYFIIMLALTAALFGEVINGHSFAGDAIRSIKEVDTLPALATCQEERDQ